MVGGPGLLPWFAFLLLAAVAADPQLRCTNRGRPRQLREGPGGSCAPLLDSSVPAPVTPKHPELLHANASWADVPPRTDDYAWLRDDARNDSAVLSHLQEESAYADAVLAPSKGLQARLLAEMKGRLPREEASVPQRRGRHWYYTVRGEGSQYGRICRRPVADPEAEPTEHDAMDASQPEQVLLDQDELAGQQRAAPFLNVMPSLAAVAAGGRSYFDLAGPEWSVDEGLAAFGVDARGDEVYALYVKDLTSGQLVLDGSKDTYAPPFRSCSGDFAFMADHRTLLFVTVSGDTKRADKARCRVWWFQVGAPPTSASGAGRQRAPGHQARLLYHEPDERFQLSLWRSRSDAVIYLGGSTDSTQYLWYLPSDAVLDGPDAANFSLLAPAVPERQVVVRDHPAAPSSGSAGGGDGSGDEAGGGSGSSSSGYVVAIVYTEESRNGELVVASLRPDALPAAPGASSSNPNSSSAGDGGGARKMAEGSTPAADAPGAAPGPDGAGSGSVGGGSEPAPDPHFALLQAHSREVELVDISLSAGHLAVLERRNGTLAVTSYPLPEDGTPPRELPKGQRFAFEAPSFALAFGGQGPWASPLLRVRFSSLTQPDSVYDIHMKTGNRVLKQQQEVVGYDPTRYLARLLWAPSTDGAAVPISVVYRGDAVKLDGSDPLLLEAYGAYGASREPTFSGARLSLLDRGVVYALAHPRGGGALGRYWWADGKLLAKNHTFDDVAAAADALVAAKYAAPGRIALWGRSAGGLTAGAVVNRRPGLLQAAILDVPFVDVLSSMSDPSLPLTATEYDEWGNPSADPAAYANMRSYSPVDNVAAQPYPHLLLTAGLNDPRVAYWEPAKLAAKVRELKTSNDSLVLLKTALGAGHYADSGIEARLREMAYKYAFLVATLAPCAGQDRSTTLDGTCRGCFPIFVAILTTCALLTLVVVLNPRSRMGRRWRRLQRGGAARLGFAAPPGSGDSEDDDDEEGGSGFDTRRYASHLSDAQLAAETERQRAARQQQLEQEGLSLAPYEAVRATVRDRLLPTGPQSAGAAPGGPSPPPRRLQLGGSPSRSPARSPAGSGVELAAMGGTSGRRAGVLSPVPESPTSMASLQSQ